MYIFMSGAYGRTVGSDPWANSQWQMQQALKDSLPDITEMIRVARENEQRAAEAARE